MISRTHYRPGLLLRPAATDWLTFVVVFGVAASGLALIAITPRLPVAALLPFFGCFAAIVLWRWPVASVFGLFAMATLIEVFALHFPDSVTDRIPLWRNLSSSGLAGIKVSPAELLMFAGFAVWFVRGFADGWLKLHTSKPMRAYGWYLVPVLFAAAHGIAIGANTTVLLWEVRFQVYAMLASLLALNLLKSRRHVELLAWIIILGTGIKGLQGTYRYLVTFGGRFEGNEILEHDEALFFPAFYIFLLLHCIFGGSRRQKQVGFALLPAVMIADFANKRRASTGALVIALLVLAVILFIHSRRRMKFFRGALTLLVVMALYTGAFWNSPSRIAQPLQAIRSQITPGERDAYSNLYRVQENENLFYAIQHHMLFGRGYGIEMENVSNMVIITQIAPFILYMPHNSILWVWWRTGIVGFTLFWLALGLAIMRMCSLARGTTDPYLRRWATFAAIVVVIHLLIGWWDQGLFGYRQIVYTWTLLAVPEVLIRLPSNAVPTSQSAGGSA